MAILGPFDFRGGYSPGYDFDTLPQEAGYATTMENCRFENGYIIPRWGQQLTNNAPLGTGNMTIGMTSWVDTVNAKTALVVAYTSKIFIADLTGYTSVSAAVTFTDRTGAVTVSNSTTNMVYTFDSLNNILVMAGNSVNSVAPIKVTAWNANAAALGGSPPNGDCVKQCNNFLFLSRDLSSTTKQSNVYWSNVNDPETWTGTNVLSVSKNDGEPIMALGAIGPVLYIFKRTSIWSLNATTISVSGAVTLGPLQQVIKGIGCCGPRALDNLPNGNIVFVGTDGHFYEFDGSSLSDRSRSPFPGPNAFDLGQRNPSHSNNFGLRAGSADTNVCVKVVHGINEVWVSYQTGIIAGYRVFIYNFEQKNWQGSLDSLGASVSSIVGCMATIPYTSSATFGTFTTSTDLLFHGNGDNVVTHDVGTYPYPTDESHAGQQFSVGTTIQFAKEASDFVPRTLIFETTRTNNGAASKATLSNLTVYADYDAYSGTIANAAIYTSSGGVLPTRVIVNLPQKQDTVASVAVSPTFLSLLWVGTGGGSGITTDIFRLGKFYLSDEVLR